MLSTRMESVQGVYLSIVPPRDVVGPLNTKLVQPLSSLQSSLHIRGSIALVL